MILVEVHRLLHFKRGLKLGHEFLPVRPLACLRTTMSNPLILRKFAALGQNLWDHLPPAARKTQSLLTLSHGLHFLARKYANRGQSQATYFLRNTPLIRAVSETVRDDFPEGSVGLGIIGCSTGAEVYSLLWMIHKVIANLRVNTVALDISASCVEAAQMGTYRLGSPEFRKQLPQEILDELFDKGGETLKIKSCHSQGIRWLVADARDPGLLDLIGAQDILLANNFLVHMKPVEAEPCMRGLLRLVRPGGFFVCRGVDLDLRERVALSAGLEPITTQIEEIHNADPDIDAPKGWPWRYWGLEPLDRSRKNWPARYSVIFRVPAHG